MVTNNTSEVGLWAEYLYYDGGAKYVSINQAGAFNPGQNEIDFQKTVLTSGESIKVKDVDFVYEYSRFCLNNKFITWLGCYTPSDDRKSGERGGVACIGLWVADGLVDFDTFIDAVPQMLQELKDGILPDEALQKMIAKVHSTAGAWLPGEPEFGVAWRQELLDDKTAVINQAMDSNELKQLIKTLGRFGSGLDFYDKLGDSNRVFIHTNEKWQESSTVSGNYKVDEDEIAVSILKKFNFLRKLDQQEISDLKDVVNTTQQRLDEKQEDLIRLNDQNISLQNDLNSLKNDNSSENKLARIEALIGKINISKLESIGKKDSLPSNINQDLKYIKNSLDFLKNSPVVKHDRDLDHKKATQPNMAHSLKVLIFLIGLLLGLCVNLVFG